MNDFPLLSTDRLAQYCEEHTARFKAKEPSNGAFCYELFRRAAYDMPLAWDYVFQLYGSHIRKKISDRFSGSTEDVEDVFQTALIKFRRNVLTPERFRKFSNLGSIITYLNSCIHSVVIDALRKQDKQKRLETFSLDDEEVAVEPVSSETNMENSLMEKEWRHKVKDCIKSHCKHRFDELLVRELWVNDLKPRDVFKQFPDKFSSVNQIRTQKRNLVDRIKRDPACRSLLGHAPI